MANGFPERRGNELGDYVVMSLPQALSRVLDKCELSLLLYHVIIGIRAITILRALNT